MAGRERYNDPDNIANIRHHRIDREAYRRTEFGETIFVYRDPIDRAVSTYLNKFVDAHGAGAIFRNYLAVTGSNPNLATFEDFLHYAAADFSRLDCHLWPQKSHLWDIEYTRPIDIKALLAAMTDLLGAEQAHRYFAKNANPSDSNSGSLQPQQLTDVPASHLRRMRNNGEAINKRCFLNAGVTAFIQDRYQDDYRMISEVSSDADQAVAAESG